MDESNFVVYSRPQGPEIGLHIPPRIAKWVGKASPLRRPLTEYLDSVEKLIRTANVPDEGLTLDLTVGLPEGTDILSSGDLDNYLIPVAQRLGSNRFVSVWGEKRIGTSTIRLEAARSEDAEDLRQGWRFAPVRTTSSASATPWKKEIAAQLADMESAPEGPVEVQLSFRVGPTRNWANLWKPAIDSLEAVLGTGPWWNSSPRDGRIVRLGLHRSVDPHIGNDIAIGIWWRAGTNSRS